jgi:cytochrome c
MRASFTRALSDYARTETQAAYCASSSHSHTTVMRRRIQWVAVRVELTQPGHRGAKITQCSDLPGATVRCRWQIVFWVSVTEVSRRRGYCPDFMTVMIAERCSTQFGQLSRSLSWLVILAGSLALSAIGTAVAQPRAEEPDLTVPAERRGWRFVRVYCSRCHAIDQAGESPLAAAPLFRALQLKYPVADLQRPLANGVHQVMPRFQLEAGQVEDIMAYLNTLIP